MGTGRRDRGAIMSREPGCVQKMVPLPSRPLPSPPLPVSLWRGNSAKGPWPFDVSSAGHRAQEERRGSGPVISNQMNSYVGAGGRLLGLDVAAAPTRSDAVRLWGLASRTIGLWGSSNAGPAGPVHQRHAEPWRAEWRAVEAGGCRTWQAWPWLCGCALLWALDRSAVAACLVG